MKALGLRATSSLAALTMLSSRAAMPGMPRAGLLACAMLAIGLAAGAARADESFTLDASNIAGFATGSFGTIKLTDGTGTNGISVGTIGVSVALSPNVFANSGASDTFEFTLASGITITTSDITNLALNGPNNAPTITSYTLDSNPTKPTHYGFGIAIDCTACGNGTSPPVYNSLAFDITAGGGLTDSDFVTNDPTHGAPGGYYFVADIGIAQNNSFMTGYATANTGVPTPPQQCTNGATNYPACNNQNTPLPEPASLLVLASGLIGLAGLQWRRVR